MRKLLLMMALFCVMAAVKIRAQQHFIFRVGGGICTTDGGNTKTLGAFNIGVGYEYEFDQHWSIEPGVLYFSKGWKEKTQTVAARDEQGNFVYDEHGNQVFGKKGVNSHANYLEVPVLMNYYVHLTSPHYLSFSFGPYVGCGIGGKTETYGDTERQGAERLYYEQNTFSIDGVRRFDAGLSLAVGYEYNRRINLSVNADIGMLKISDKNGRNVSFFLGFAYRL